MYEGTAEDYTSTTCNPLGFIQDIVDDLLLTLMLEKYHELLK